MNVKELWPNLVNEDSAFGVLTDLPNYIDIVKQIGEVQIEITVRDYSGDSVFLLKEPGTERIGILNFGWGSCSGCDALQACSKVQDLQQLCDSLVNQTKWFPDKRQAMTYLEEHDWEGDYTYNEPPLNVFPALALAYLDGAKIEVCNEHV